MTQVFVSYAHVSPDRDLAAKLLRSLEANGIAAFIDSKIGVGQNWVEQIEVQLRRSTHLVVLLSAQSMKSDMVRREVAMGYRLNKANKLTILPVRLDFDEELPYELGAYLDLIQYVIWRPEESFDGVCEIIVNAIRGPRSTIANGQPAAAVPRFAGAQIESVKAELARHLGPIAGICVLRVKLVQVFEWLNRRICRNALGQEIRVALLQFAHQRLYLLFRIQPGCRGGFHHEFRLRADAVLRFAL